MIDMNSLLKLYLDNLSIICLKLQRQEYHFKRPNFLKHYKYIEILNMA